MFATNRRIDIYINGVYETSTVSCRTLGEAEWQFCKEYNLSPEWNRVKATYPKLNTKK